MKRELRTALDLVKERIQALFDPDFLRQPQDEMEGVLLHDLRNHYIPDCILAYNSTLYFAGHALSRAYLVDCMDLAQMVATNPMLTAAFVESRRMKELVQAFALDSQALLRANEQGGMKAKRTKADQGNSEIWNVAWREQGNNADLEALD
jgi:nuclear pore complex protein Nup107